VNTRGKREKKRKNGIHRRKYKKKPKKNYKV